MTVNERAGGRRRLAAAILYTVAVFAACSIPGDAIPESILLSWDKLWHVLAFAAFVVVWRYAGRRALPIAAWGFAFGLLIEVWQDLAPIGRFFDPLDLLANAAGIALGFALTAAAGRFLRAT